MASYFVNHCHDCYFGCAGIVADGMDIPEQLDTGGDVHDDDNDFAKLVQMVAVVDGKTADHDTLNVLHCKDP